MKTLQKMTTVEMLLDIDPVTDFASFQNCLPPLLKLQANLFGEHIPTEQEEMAALEKFRSMYGRAMSGFDRRKSDRRTEIVRHTPDHAGTIFRRRKCDTSHEANSRR